MTPSFHLTERYQVQEAIGHGGGGQVFRAWDTQLSRWVALKRLHAQAGEDPHDTTKIFQEATTLAALQHPNIVTIYDFGADELGPFVVMELLEGENLEQVIARGVFPLPDFLSLVRQSLEGVIAAHHAGLIHRDLKPGNLMLSWLPSGAFQVKVLDFGLARFISEPQLQTVDHTGHMMGSVFCMAPEQFNLQPLDARTDLYSLGCLFYYAVVGQFPFRGDTVQDVMIAHLQHFVTPLEQLRRDLPPALCHWVMRLTQVDPAQRYSSAVEALQAFNEIALPNQTTMQVPIVPPQNSDTLWIGLSAVTVLLLAGGAWWWHQHQPTQTVVEATLPGTVETVRPTTEVTSPKETPPLVQPTTSVSSPASATISANDMEALRAVKGQAVTVQGQVVVTGENKSGTMRYLNFDQDFKKALTLVFKLKTLEAPKEKLESYVGKKVQATGEITEYQGAMQMVIKDFNQIEVK